MALYASLHQYLSGRPVQGNVLCQGTELHLEDDRESRQLHGSEGLGHHVLLVPPDLDHHAHPLDSPGVPGLLRNLV